MPRNHPGFYMYSILKDVIVKLKVPLKQFVVDIRVNVYVKMVLLVWDVINVWRISMLFQNVSVIQTTFSEVIIFPKNPYKWSNFPNLKACDCDTFGSNGTACNENGQCNCFSNFDGNKCNVCKPGSYMYPRCLGKFI